MESITSGSLSKTSHALADKADNKVQSVVGAAQESVKDMGSALSSKITEVQDKAAPLIRKTSGRAQAAAQQSVDAVSDMAGQARDMAAHTADSIVSYTKKNPVTALAIAAAAGVVLYTAINTLRSSRD